VEVLTMPPEPGAILSLAFSPDGRRLAAANASGPVHIWDAPPADENDK
jgi:WD40 repeat protein